MGCCRSANTVIAPTLASSTLIAALPSSTAKYGSYTSRGCAHAYAVKGMRVRAAPFRPPCTDRRACSHPNPPALPSTPPRQSSVAASTASSTVSALGRAVTESRGCGFALHRVAGAASLGVGAGGPLGWRRHGGTLLRGGGAAGRRGLALHRAAAASGLPHAAA